MIYRCTFYRKQIQERTIFLVFDFLQFDFCETWQTCWSPGNPRDKGKIWCWQCWPACTDPAFKNPHASPFEFKIFPPTQHCAGTAHFQPSFWGILTFQQRGCHHREAKVEEHWLEQLCSAQKMWCRRFWIPWCLWFDWVAFSDRGWDSRFDPMCVN